MVSSHSTKKALIGIQAELAGISKLVAAQNALTAAKAKTATAGGTTAIGNTTPIPPTVTRSYSSFAINVLAVGAALLFAGAGF